jgi:hypothetical protein
MAYVPANNWLIAFGVLAGGALLASLVLAVLFVLVARRRGVVPARAIAISFAVQAVLVLVAWLAVEDPRDGLRFYVFILAPLAVAHLLLLPIMGRK